MVPKEWTLKTIEDIALVSSGGTPSRKTPEYWNGEIPWVTTAEVQFKVITNTSEKITVEGLKNSSAKLFPVDTILMAMYGQGKTRGQVAKLGIEATTNQASAAIVINSGHCADYYYQYLIHQYGNIRDLSNKGGQENLSSGIVKSIPVPVPPLPEQKKIAEILSTWDDAIAASEDLLANSRQRKKALMQKLLTGKTRLPGFEGEWKKCSIGDLLKIGSGKDYKHLGSGNIPVYGTGGYMLSVNDYLYDGDSVCIGRKGTIDNPFMLHGKFWTVDTLFYTHSFNCSDPHYIYHLFCSINWKAYNEASGVPSLSKTTIEKIKIAVPSLDEQQAIARVLNTARDEIEALEQRINNIKIQKKALMQQLLTGNRRVTLSCTRRCE